MRIASPGRVAVIASLAAAVALGSGCSWFRKDNEAYKLSGEARPLEIPPDLDRPSADAAMNLPAGGSSVMASQTGNRAGASAATAAGAFSVAGPREAAFTRIDQALAGIQGASVRSRSQLLGSFDVSYGGVDFLIRTLQSGERVSVSAVDPRGLPEARAEAQALLGQLKTALGGQ